MNMYRAIFGRRSVRKFLMEPVALETLDKIRNFISKLTPLDGESRVELVIHEHIGNREKIKGLMKINAPYYLLVYCEHTEAAYRNAGYMAEQAVLYITGKELGSCYLGESKIGEMEKNGLKQLLIIAFGHADGHLLRSEEDAHRLPLSALCVYKDEPGEAVKAMIRAARMAPSSLNSQPWRFVVYADRIYIFARKEWLWRTKQFAAMREFNMGIVFSHIMVAAEEFWMNMETMTEEQFLKKNYKNGDYVCTIVFHN